MYNKAVFKFSVESNPVLLLDIIQKLDIGNTIRMVPDCPIPLQVTVLSHRNITGFAVQNQTSLYYKC